MQTQPAVATPSEQAGILYEVRGILAERQQIACSFAPSEADLIQISTLQEVCPSILILCFPEKTCS